MEFKYIMFNRVTYVLFSVGIEHITMRDALKKELGECKVTSAGFAQFLRGPDGQTIVKCFGESNSLKIPCDDRDSKIIHNMATNAMGFGSK